jgi:hypothetical protein
MPGTEGTGGIGWAWVWAFWRILGGIGAEIARGQDTHTHRFSAKSRIDSRKILALEQGTKSIVHIVRIVQPIVTAWIIEVAMN